MDIPYGFDCFAFHREEIKYFEPNLYRVRSSRVMPPPGRKSQAPLVPSTTTGQADNVKFTRKNSEQKYKPLSMHHFVYFFRAMLYCTLSALLVLILEVIHSKLA